MTADLGNVARLSWLSGQERRAARLTLPGELRWMASRGQKGPVEGSYSPEFSRRVPAVSLVGYGQVSAAAPLVTRLEFGAAASEGPDGR